MPAYIQYKDEFPVTVDMAIALHGFKDSLIDIKPFTYEQIINNEISNEILKRNVFVGTTITMQEIFKRLNKVPDSITFPDIRTDFKNSSLGEVIKQFEIDLIPVFVKPLEIKLFDGYVLKHEYDLSYLKVYPRDTKVMFSPVYDILAEFRIYVANDQIADIKNYGGDVLLPLQEQHIKEIKQILKDNRYKKNFPTTYTMDVAICRSPSPEFLVLEYNDFWAIGNYGLDHIEYAKFLRQRYFEIIR